MATRAVNRRARAQASSKAAKERRQKIMLVVGGVVLAGLLALELPKTLSQLRGASPAPAPTPATTTTASASATAAAQTASVSAALKTVSRYRTKDPFAPQLAPSSSGSDRTSPAKRPEVRTGHFVEKDPFVQQVGDTTGVPTPVLPATPPLVTGPAPLKKAKSTSAPTVKVQPGKTKTHASNPSAPHVTASVKGYVVVVASVPVARGILSAKRAALTARARGVAKANILFSARYSVLRSGFYAIYSGPYRTSAKAVQGLRLVRSSGYPTAYVRHLGR
ncbi:MAG TPA: hypothetical protein VNH40_11495 [Gaiellaceae bacterium]|nr:hypothetical protein [Gaiellaceae bacterium]